MIGRRDFITLVGGAATWPVAARAQRVGQTRRIGMLIGGSANDPGWQRYAAAFRETLAKLGWIDGGNLRIEICVAFGDIIHARASAAELVSLSPDVIFASSGVATRAVQGQTKTIPIVFTGPSNAVAGENEARPAGNITGFPILYPSIAGKWVQLLREADIRVARVALVHATDTGYSAYISPIEEAAQVLAVKVVPAPFGDAAELAHAIDAFAAEPDGGLIVLPGAATSTRDSREVIRALAARHRLPAIHWDSSYPAEGGLMSYGSNFEELHRRAATYVDRILRGAKVSELPIERPTKFELSIDVKTAKTLGLAVPPSLLAVADEVIE
jgi:putative ABC transport system substrate-binding protein